MPGKQSAAKSTASKDIPPQLFEHVLREDWGRAMLMWERETKRGYQFEDGQLRVFKKGFYHLLKPVAASDTPDGLSLDDLTKRVKLAGKRRKAREKAKKNKRTLYTLDDQITAFGVEFPKGFTGDTWREKIRGGEGVRRLKRHRDPAIAQARELLAPDELQALLAAGDTDEIYKRALAVASCTDMVTTTHAKAIKNLRGDGRVAFAEALVDLLYGTDPHSARFDSFVGTMKSCAWPLATVFSALVYPTEHVCVRPSSFRSQARWMDPDLDHPTVPNAEIYRRYLAMTLAIRDELERNSQSPADLLDVSEFIRLTTRQAAKRLARMTYH